MGGAHKLIKHITPTYHVLSLVYKMGSCTSLEGEAALQQMTSSMADNHIHIIQLVCLLILASVHFINAKSIDSFDDSGEPGKHFDGANGLTLEALTDRQNGCYWAGTAPACRGSCPANYYQKRRDDCGDGKCCWSGDKKYCCPKVNRKAEAGAVADRQNGCYWDGTAPACEGRCPNGFKEIKSSKKGDGSYCWSGYKKYCCPK